MDYCKDCSIDIINLWKGWPHKNAIPLLPRIIGESCGVCNNNNKLNNEEIVWHNHHGEYNTGLPDYWLILIESSKNKWGLPYFSEGTCPRCNSRTIISEMNYPNGKRETKHNCKKCGIRKTE